VFIDPVVVNLKRLVRVVYQGNTMMRGNIRTNEKDALERIESDRSGGGFLELAGETDKAHYQIAVNEKGEYEIWDPAGKAIPNLNPVLTINDIDFAVRVIQRLVHLTKYSNIQQLDSLDAASPLSRKLIVELLGVSQDYEPGDNPMDGLHCRAKFFKV
jgi:hypothetical protein